MRVDKYLKVARILKRRVVAKELASENRLLINGRVVKAGTEVKLNDEIKIIFGHREITVRVLEIKEQASKQEALAMYEIVEERKEDGV